MARKAKDNYSDVMSSIIGDDAKLSGKLSLKGSVRIDGSFDGILQCEGAVTVGHKGAMTGNIEADQVIIGGRVTGSVVARSRLVLEGSAEMSGDLATNTLVVFEGAKFNGNSGMGSEAVEDLKRRQGESEAGQAVPLQVAENRKLAGTGITLYDDEGETLDEDEDRVSAQAN